jgi:hypothetical protein
LAQSNETLAGYIQRVRRMLHEVTASASYHTDDLLKELFNDQYRMRCNDLAVAHEGYFTDVAITDLVANQARYPWPPGFERLLRLEIVRDDGTQIPIQRFERHEHANLAPSASGEGYWPQYRPIGSGFVLEPAPAEDDVDALRIEYYGLPARLTADGDTLHADFPLTFASLLVYDTVVAALDTELMQENGVVKTILRLRQEFEIRWERYIDGRITSQTNVVPFTGNYSDA